MIKKNTTILQLHLGNFSIKCSADHQIGDESAEAIARSIETNNIITLLDLG